MPTIPAQSPEVPAPMMACPVCGDHPSVERWVKPIPIRAFDVEIACDGCADCDSHVSSGATRADAVRAWNDYCRDAAG